MACHIHDTKYGRFFVCGKFPEEKKERCSVCGKRWATLLCDGRVDGAVLRVDVKGKAYAQPEPKTCDAPLCDACTTRAAPGVIALPDHRESDMNGMHVLQTERRLAAARRRRQAGPATRLRNDLPPPPPRPEPVDMPADTVDFCPACARRMSEPQQQALPFSGG
ncbi:hypothetical protein [Corallococcus sp. 4LFB]|uniref:hypothetical protein n=1 Tax=Corallococcus sp. 4LFB TaxID=3383249 RepID=UPI003974D00D